MNGMRKRKQITDSKSGNKEGWSTQGRILYKHILSEIEEGRNNNNKDKESKKEQRQKEQECDMIKTLGKDDKDYKFYIEYMKNSKERRALYDEALGRSTSNVSPISPPEAKKRKSRRKKKQTKTQLFDSALELVANEPKRLDCSRTTTTVNSSIGESIDRTPKKEASKKKRRRKKSQPLSEDQQEPATVATASAHLHSQSTQSSGTFISEKDPLVKKRDLAHLGRNKGSSRSKSIRLGFDGAVNSIPASPPSETSEESFLGATLQRGHNSSANRSTVSVKSNTTGNNRSNRSCSDHSFGSSIHSTRSTDRNHQHLYLIDLEGMMNDSQSMKKKKVVVEATGFLDVNPEEPIERSLKLPDDETPQSSSTSRKKIVWLSIICVVVIAAVITPCVLLLGGSGGNSTNFPKLSEVGSNTVVASISDDICDEDIPRSGLCTLGVPETEKQGGELCNLVAKSMINTTVYGDIALINAGICQDNLLLPEITAGNIKNVIVPENLVAVEMSGIDLKNVLTQALTASFGSTGNPKAYPYAAGLRYNVEANLPPSDRLSNIEVIRGLRDDTWEPIDLRKFYTVITTESLANGELGYDSFRYVIDDWKTPLNINAGDAFYNYALTNGEDPNWSLLPNSQYSTQFFIGEGEEARLGEVPKLMCHALVPMVPESSSCKAADVAKGGQVCNFISWAIYDQNLAADIVLLKGSTCAADIEDGFFVESKIDKALSENESLVMVDLLGSQVVDLLDDLVSSGAKESYPYAAGMRFDVNKNLSPSVANVQKLTSNGSWTPIIATATYTVATTAKLGSFPTTPQPMGKTLKDDIVSYAEEWKSIYPTPAAKSSTQSYV
eukprot:jgi/Psemu1/62937/estExt_Genemark1.C_120149